MHNDQLSGQRFLIVTVLNVCITVAELLGGLIAGSLSLVSDGLHNLGDSASIVGSYYAHRVSQRPQTQKNTFGFKRAQIISAFLNSLFLIVISVFLIIEAVQKFFKPEHVDGGLMIVVAILATVANCIATLLLSKGSKHNLNMRATYLHLLSDALASIGVIIAGILIKLFNWNIVDPIITLVVAIYIMWETYPIIKKTVNILMQAAPQVDCYAIQKDLMQVKGVTGVHHVHVWSVDENSIIFSAHINMRDMMISDAEKIYDPISKLLKQKYHVTHVTLQAEVERGKKEDLYFDTGKDIK
ncbi:cation diffusion facilitator family transporter [Apilactobacillus xinyiensis]|uniref:Cation diffusion facilitator family transporter n=1 Tax=Apilactobacillus xinyiensis TaxID=2841032 RepID=A0ABT0I0M6_9LACO|nr:cation diffusion facilitator family transporter [Apilactobacillus xinyiensis]MCK8624378.1 cation diffusion facilitator family transporter [Apilactobacillus xinyiensis]MCL0318756.1 cation diffusion facilitator family transporter [Apilactobacillus xinyiensis]